MLSRRSFMKQGIKAGFSIPLWLRLNNMSALGQSGGSSGYKAIICICLGGGNDGNNTIIPYSSNEYQQYANLRGPLALPQSSLHPLNSTAYSYPLALHPSLPNIANLFNTGRGSFVANIGPLKQPATKSQILQNPLLLPQALLNHAAGVAQWESATTDILPNTGWGGRIADALVGQSGSLPMVLDAGNASIFTVGHNVQGIIVQGGTASLAPLPLGLQNAALQIAAQDSSSKNQLISQAAQLSASAFTQQLLIAKAKSSGSTLQTQFPAGGFGSELASVAQLINGRSAIGATRQIFYVGQGIYDTHTDQLYQQSKYLTEFDQGIAALVLALQEMGMSDQVLICTHSDFNRTMLANTTGGTDHGWGNHQMVIGGGIQGGKIIGTLPELEFGGSHDLSGLGTWIPTLSVTQMAAGVGSWIGLSAQQLSTTFPDLANFGQGAISLS